ncbi:MAG: MoxR family ATPase [bacterium]
MDIKQISQLVEKENEFVNKIFNEISKVIIGQKYMVERLLIGILSNGHILLEGVPGLAKTTAVNGLAKSINTKFRRIQFTPDLLPADLIGTLIYNQKSGDFIPKKGPIFSNIILADEINRAPAKVQSALLEAMQERQVTIGDTTYPLEDPFIVLATQNPIEQEGTYPLPEAQVDRFMLKVCVGYPNKKEEKQIMELNTGKAPDEIRPVIEPGEIRKARDVVRQVYMDEKIKDYIIDIVFASRNPEEMAIKELKCLIEYGASPRASIYLTLAARAHAFIRGRGYVTPEDVKAVGMDVLRHRIIVTYEAEAEETNAEDVVRKIFDSVEVP